MTITWTPLTNYCSANFMYTFLKQMETDGSFDSFKALSYVGATDNPTIGIGFDLVKGGPADQNAVLIGLGFDSNVVNASASTAATYAQNSWQSIEYGYVKQLRGLMVGGAPLSEFTTIMGQRFANLTPSFIAHYPSNTLLKSFAFTNESMHK